MNSFSADLTTDLAAPPALAVQEKCAIELLPAALNDMLATGQAVVIDVREPDEYAVERIEGSLLMPLSMFDADKFPRILDRRVVFVCAIGKRSAAAAKQVLNAGFPEAFNLAGGLIGWKTAGFEIEA